MSGLHGLSVCCFPFTFPSTHSPHPLTISSSTDCTHLHFITPHHQIHTCISSMSTYLSSTDTLTLCRVLHTCLHDSLTDTLFQLNPSLPYLCFVSCCLPLIYTCLLSYKIPACCFLFLV